MTTQSNQSEAQALSNQVDNPCELCLGYGGDNGYPCPECHKEEWRP